MSRGQAVASISRASTPARYSSISLSNCANVFRTRLGPFFRRAGGGALMEYGNLTDGFDAAVGILAGTVIDLGLLEGKKDALDTTFLDRGKELTATW